MFIDAAAAASTSSSTQALLSTSSFPASCRANSTSHHANTLRDLEELLLHQEFEGVPFEFGCDFATAFEETKSVVTSNAMATSTSTSLTLKREDEEEADAKRVPLKSSSSSSSSSSTSKPLKKKKELMPLCPAPRKVSGHKRKADKKALANCNEDDDMEDAVGSTPPIPTHVGRWTKKEHELFLEGLRMYGKSWKKISSLVVTRTLVQIRTHAQKYLQKQSKSAQKAAGTAMSPSTASSDPRPSSSSKSSKSSSSKPSKKHAASKSASKSSARSSAPLLVSSVPPLLSDPDSSQLSDESFALTPLSYTDTLIFSPANNQANHTTTETPSSSHSLVPPLLKQELSPKLEQLLHEEPSQAPSTNMRQHSLFDGASCDEDLLPSAFSCVDLNSTLSTIDAPWHPPTISTYAVPMPSKRRRTEPLLVAPVAAIAPTPSIPGFFGFQSDAHAHHQQPQEPQQQQPSSQPPQFHPHRPLPHQSNPFKEDHVDEVDLHVFGNWLGVP